MSQLRVRFKRRRYQKVNHKPYVKEKLKQPCQKWKNQKRTYTKLHTIMSLFNDNEPPRPNLLQTYIHCLKEIRMKMALEDVEILHERDYKM